LRVAFRTLLQTFLRRVLQLCTSAITRCNRRQRLTIVH